MPSISVMQDRARELFRQMHEEKTLKGRANDAIAASCLYIACRQEGVPRSFKGEEQANWQPCLFDQYHVD